MNCKQLFLHLSKANFRANQKKDVLFSLIFLLFHYVSDHLILITVNLVTFWNWSVPYSCSSWCLLAIITEFQYFWRRTPLSKLFHIDESSAKWELKKVRFVWTKQCVTFVLSFVIWWANFNYSIVFIWT